MTDPQPNEYDEALNALQNTSHVAAWTGAYADVIVRALRLASRFERPVSQKSLNAGIVEAVGGQGYIISDEALNEIFRVMLAQAKREARE